MESHLTNGMCGIELGRFARSASSRPLSAVVGRGRCPRRLPLAVRPGRAPRPMAWADLLRPYGARTIRIDHALRVHPGRWPGPIGDDTGVPLVAFLAVGPAKLGIGRGSRPVKQQSTGCGWLMSERELGPSYGSSRASRIEASHGKPHACLVFNRFPVEER